MIHEHQARQPYQVPNAVHALSQEHIGSRGYFYVGGAFAERDGTRDYLHGQMYVEVLVPKTVTRPYPLVLFHGGGQTGLNWMATPDGRPGWADHFVSQGYVVYVPDVPARGRSPYHPAVDGPLTYMTADLTRTYFASDQGPWPTARLHDQWPASGQTDQWGYDAHYQALCAAQVEYLPPAQQQALVRQAGAELLRTIGPSVLVTHSMAGPYGWILADTCPDLVRGIVALEPSGPPFAGISISSGRQRPYGIADIPLTYDPPISLPHWRRPEEGPLTPPPLDDIDAWLQPGPVGRLTHLSQVPVLLLTAEASYHAPFDHLTAAFLRQAGVVVEHCLLAKRDIHGNGHMMMMELNNLEIAALVQDWIQSHCR